MLTYDYIYIIYVIICFFAARGGRAGGGGGERQRDASEASVQLFSRYLVYVVSCSLFVWLMRLYVHVLTYYHTYIINSSPFWRGGGGNCPAVLAVPGTRDGAVREYVGTVQRTYELFEH